MGLRVFGWGMIGLGSVYGECLLVEGVDIILYHHHVFLCS